MRWRGRGRGCELLGSAAVGELLGGAISVVVNNALIEISLTPFFAAVFGGVLLLLGSLMGARTTAAARTPTPRLAGASPNSTNPHTSTQSGASCGRSTSARSPATPCSHSRA